MPVSYTHLDVYKRQVFANGYEVRVDTSRGSWEILFGRELLEACLLYTSRCV